MRTSLATTFLSTAYIVLAFFTLHSAGYFVINEPNKNTQWVNNAANVVTWSKGLKDGIHGFDVELARMSQDGLRLVARNVPVKPNNINLFLSDVPAGDDYFLIFINSTHGVMHTTSDRFTILASGVAPTATSTVQLAANAPTVTIRGTPNPTAGFATTFPAISGAVGKLNMDGIGIKMTILFAGWIFGAVWTLGW
ncbi:hypothetical protein CVT24_006005 [Panaeolus cyanescens]|uniref:Uncharacterized protein n=1 Tax=Panaeolus cyanescens TaxID=181874 RepID=A0A409YE21_9AGAR|nr:hypothetical protein CVT24_006005 [Panaeolus cyanescens]